MARRSDLLKALAAQGGSRTDLSAMAAALTVAQQRAGLAPGRMLPRPPQTFDGQFAPMTPPPPWTIDPYATPREGGPDPRIWEYPIGYNLPSPPDTYKRVTFNVLSTIADTVDVVRAAIEVRKDEIATAAWDITLKDESQYKSKGKSYKRDEKAAIVGFFERPDPTQDMDFVDWIKAIVEEVLVKDALSIYPRPTVGRGRGVLGSNLFALTVLDGSTVKPLMDIQGGIPQPPNVAYQQYLYGVPRSDFAAPIDDALADFTTADLIYRRYNRRPGTAFGLPPVEYGIIPAISYLRRSMWWQAYYNNGDLPAMFVFGNEGWTPDELEHYEAALHALLAGDPDWKWRLKFLPFGTKVQEVKQPNFETQFDEYLIKVVGMCLHVTAMELGFSPKGGLGGKGFSEEQSDVQERKGRKPLFVWLQGMFTRIINHYFNEPELCFKFTGLEVEDEKLRAQIDQQRVFAGLKTVNEVREANGDDSYGADVDPEGVASKPLLVVGNTAMLLSQVGAPPPAPLLPPANGDQGDDNPPPDGGNGAKPKLPGNGGNGGAASDQQGQQQQEKPNPAATKAASGDAAAELAAFERFAAKGARSRPFTFTALPERDAAALNKALLTGDAAALKTTISAIRKYSDDEPRDDHGRWTDGGGASGPSEHEKEGGESTTAPQPSNDKAARAIASYKPSTKAKQDQGDQRQRDVAAALNGEVSKDNAPMDVLTEHAGIEVKTLTDNGNDKITMHPDSRQRKEQWAQATGKKLYTVVVDDRDTFGGGANAHQYSGNRFYVKEGVGAFRIKSMTAVADTAALHAFIYGGR